LGLWKRRDSRLELQSRIMRRSASMRAHAACNAQNPLHGIAYHFDAGTRTAVLEYLDRWMDDSFELKDDAYWLVGTDLLLVCGGIFAQKDKGMFDASHARVVYPFLTPQMFQLSLQRAILWPRASEAKAPLKRALARHVPPEMVYRPKAGFTGVPRDMFRSDYFVSLLAEAAESAMLKPYVDERFVRTMCRHLHSGVPMAQQTYSFGWALAFTYAWLRGLHGMHHRQ
jgi:hypothetical protein